jgi:hypothetical protein
MKTGRPDLDAMLRVTSIPGDEPVFVVRAQDAVGADTVRAWAELALTAGAPIAVVESALKQADAMEAWKVKKIADADHLTPDQVRRLEHEYARRQWNLGQFTPLAIAERRGRMTVAEILNGADAAAVLGIMNFQTIALANLFRASGVEIPRKAEAEQAYVLRFLLQLVIEFGAGWREAAHAEIGRMQEQIRAGAAKASA